MLRPLLTPEEMARADRAAIAAGTPGHVLMERAGRAVARAALDLCGGRYGRRAVIVCGKGNNGGDGLVAARRLAGEGLKVSCLLLCEPHEVRGDAAHHLGALRACGIEPEPFSEEELERADVVIDAIFGTGFRGPASGTPARAIEAISSFAGPVLAVDVPSGVDGETGRAEGAVVQADVTVALAAQKVGTAVGDGALAAGVVEVADIGVAPGEARVHMAEAHDVASVLPRRAPDAHKHSAGIVAILAGARGLSGAAVLCARGAARAGAGYVVLGAPDEVERAAAAALPEVVKLPLGGPETLGPEAFEAFSETLGRASALALGPGLGRGAAQGELVARVLGEARLPVVVDADALNALAGNPGPLLARRAPCVLTPHPGELARLLATTSAAIQADRLGAARAAAERFGCVVLLKGMRTVVAEPSGRAVVNPTGGPELATAGTGDVLTGVIATLLAAGAEPFAAAWASAYLHGLAGAIAARGRGCGVLAGDVAEALPKAAAVL